MTGALPNALPRTRRPPSPWLTLAGRRRPTYGVCVIGGGLGGLAIAALLALATGLDLLLLAASLTGAVAAALALAFGSRWLLGEERFTFYHYQLACLAGAALPPLALGVPALPNGALPFLDLLAVALALTQGVGRLGCLSAGCCHGRPTGSDAGPHRRRWAIAYTAEHAAAGFPRRLVGVPLLPVQAIESAALLTLTAALAALIAPPIAPPIMNLSLPAGSALIVYLAGYGLVRFLLERLRGDRRPRRAGLSEAQLTALVSLLATGLLTAAGLLPGGLTGGALLLGLAAALLIVARRDRRHRRHAGGLVDGEHAGEIAALLQAMALRSRRDAGSIGAGPIGVDSRPVASAGRDGRDAEGDRSGTGGWTVALPDDPPSSRRRPAVPDGAGAGDRQGNGASAGSSQRPAAAAPPVRVATTSRGLRLSSSSFEAGSVGQEEGGEAGRRTRLWTFSTDGSQLGRGEADEVARLLLRLAGGDAARLARGPAAAGPVSPGSQVPALIAAESGVWHLLAPATAGGAARTEGAA